MDVVTTGVALICIGMNACQLTTTQSCSVALGDNVELPAGAAGSHVLATPTGVEPLDQLTPTLIARINREIERFGGQYLDPRYVAVWNKDCAPVPGV